MNNKADVFFHPSSLIPHPEEESVGTASHKSLRVLFVDDEKSLQEFMRSELPRLGHEVTVCPDGRSRAEGPGEEHVSTPPFSTCACRA